MMTHQIWHLIVIAQLTGSILCDFYYIKYLIFETSIKYNLDEQNIDNVYIVNKQFSSSHVVPTYWAGLIVN